MKMTKRSSLLRLVSVMLALIMMIGCLAGCGNGQQADNDDDDNDDDGTTASTGATEPSETEPTEPDPRDELEEYTWNGLTFYLDDTFEEDYASDDVYALYSLNEDSVTSCVVTCCDLKSSFGKWIPNARRYAEAVRDSIREDVSIEKANGVRYFVYDVDGVTNVMGFYVEGGYGWSIHLDCPESDSNLDAMIAYATLGHVEDGFEPDLGPNLPTEPPEETAPSTGPYPDALDFVIKVWAPAEDQRGDNDWLQIMQAQFDAMHPEYDITWVNESVDEGDAAGRVIMDVSAAADVYMFSSDQLVALINAGGLSQFGGPFLEQILNDNNQFMINTVTYVDGGQYGFPVTGNTWFMYYDKSVFTEEDVKSLDVMLTKGKVCLPLANSWNAGCFFLGCGGKIFGDVGNDVFAGIQFGKDNGGYIAAKKMIELVSNPNVVTGGMDSGKLSEGKVDACFSGSWDAAKLKNDLGDRLGVAPLPTFEADGRTYKMTAMSGSKCIGVNPASGSVEKKQKACTEFAAFLASADAQMVRYAMRGVIPSHKGLASAPMITADPIAMAEINTIANSSVVQSALPQMGNFWDPMGSFGRSLCDGDINLDNYKDMVDQLNRQLNGC